jgi:hypothetical protein
MYLMTFSLVTPLGIGIGILVRYLYIRCFFLAFHLCEVTSLYFFHEKLRIPGIRACIATPTRL